jgi:hypothetical protein
MGGVLHFCDVYCKNRTEIRLVYMIFSYYYISEKETKLMGSDQGRFLLGRHIQKAQEYVRKYSSHCHPILFNP